MIAVRTGSIEFALARARRRLKAVAPYLYLVPAVAFVGAFLLYPAAYTLVISFTEWDGLKPPRWIGLGNFIRLARDPAFLSSLGNTAIWVVATLAIPVFLGLVVAASVNRIRGEAVFKSIFYLPYTISAAATGILWTFVFEPTQGVVDTLLKVVGLEGWIRPWLVTPGLNTASMIAAYTWQTMGTHMVLFLVGLQSIPQEPVEAAKIDGATKLQAFLHVTLPLLRPILTVVVTMAIVNSFKVFDLIWVMTKGGPFRSSETLAVTMYRESFILFHLGYGASIATLLSIISFAFSWTYLRSAVRSESMYR